jgi:hypothetical protein
MRNALIYLLMFFAFYVLASGQANSKKDISAASSCQATNVQYHIDGATPVENLSGVKYHVPEKKVVPWPGSDPQPSSIFFKLPVSNLRYCQTKIIGLQPPARKLFHLNLYGSADNDDGDPHFVA